MKMIFCIDGFCLPLGFYFQDPQPVHEETAPVVAEEGGMCHFS